MRIEYSRERFCMVTLDIVSLGEMQTENERISERKLSKHFELKTHPFAYLNCLYS